MAWHEERGPKAFRGVYIDAQGAQRKTITYPTKKAALAAANDEEAKVRAGTWFNPAAGKVTFSAYFEQQWLPNRGGEVTTIATYRSHYNATLKAKFGHMELHPEAERGCELREDK